MAIKTIYRSPLVEEFIIQKVKAPMMQGFNGIFYGAKGLAHLRALWESYKAMKRLPEPTKENTSQANTKILIDLRDEFFKWEDNPGRLSAFKVIWNFAIIVYDYDAYYRDRINWFVERLFQLSAQWQPRDPYKPRMTFWHEHDEMRARKMAEKEAAFLSKKYAVQGDGEPILAGQACLLCQGEVDRLKDLQNNPAIWQGRCFQCGHLYIVLTANKN